MRDHIREGVWASILAGALFLPLIGNASTATLEQFHPAGIMPPSSVTPSSAVPWYALPGRFLFSGGYYAHLSITEMRIDHVSDESRCTRKNRTFMISASFAQPIGNRLFSSRFELPLFSADRLNLTRLTPASVGDYVIHLSNAPLYNSAAQLLVSARF